MPRQTTPRLTTLIAATLAAACGDASVAPPRPATVTISPASAELTVSESTVRFRAEVRDQHGEVMDVSWVVWTSEDPQVATVDSAGLATAIGSGSATITAAVGDVSGTAQVTVAWWPAEVRVFPAADTVTRGDTLRLSAEAFDENGYAVKEVEFVWLSGEAAVATVDEFGLVTGVRVGAVTITAAVGGAKDSAEIWVEHPLVVLYNATDGPNWVDNTNWLSDAPLEEWYGVDTDEWGRVIRLDLSGRWDPEAREEVPHGLSGPVPPELGHLWYLDSLHLGKNNLSGPIPPELGNLSRLSSLDLSSNDLSGPIPPELGNLSSLRSLSIIRSRLSGPIPPELGNLSNLSSLYLRGNPLSGPIPPELGNLSNLRYLDLSSNNLSGPIPTTFLQLRPYHFFWAERHWLTGEWEGGTCAPGTFVFVEWLRRVPTRGGPFCNAADQAALTRLYQLASGDEWTESDGWLSSPWLERWHGVEIDSLGRVTALGLSDNGLSGSLPGAIADLGQLTRLRIDGNELGGRLPLGLTALDLDEFHYHGTDLCEPEDAGFRDWMDGIPSHEGTGIQCPPLTERDALVALYERTGGSGWTANGGWLSDAPVRNWHGVEVDDHGRVVGLNLDWNRLSGEIPPELGALSHLGSLRLRGNALSGSIPPQLGNLSHLVSLDLGTNALSGAVPPELGALSNLEELHLAGNALTGRIPPELGNLSNLRYLYLRTNDLSGPIPPELGNLSNLRYLHLGSNALSDPIPPELGNLSSLRYLLLGSNALSGPIPPTFRGLASLSVLELSHNAGLAGAMPTGLGDLTLESLLASRTELCVPREPALEEWLLTIPRRRIALCGEPPAAYLVQAVQSRAHPVPLVAGEDALLRVFITAAMETTEGLPDVRARFYLNGSERHVADIAGSSTPIPTEIDEGDLSKSANAEIPAGIVRPGLEMVVEIDPNGTLDASLGVPGRIPAEGRLAVEVREMPVFDLTVIPFLWTQDPDSAVIGLVGDMAADPEGHHLLEDTHVLLPVAGLDVTGRAPVASTSNNASNLLHQTEAIRVLEGGGGHYMGMMSGVVTGGGGRAYRPGRSSFSRPNSEVAQVLGHNMSLGTAPCGSAPGLDPSFPYPDGAIGAWGYDFDRKRLVPPTRKDHMGYCRPTWTSDYHFTNALVHRLLDEGSSTPAITATPVTSLLLWGGVDTTGTPFLNPVFVADAPPALPDSAGSYTVAGRDADGRELFSLSFAMPVALAAEAEVASFVFALPVRPGWANALASVTLSGPVGTATLDGDSDIPLAILRDPVTGQVRGFLGDTPVAAEQTSPPGLEVLLSHGIPDSAAWRK